MPSIEAKKLEEFAVSLLHAGGATEGEAAIVGRSLVDANLCGYDSHGVMRIPYYVTNVVKGETVSDVPLDGHPGVRLSPGGGCQLGIWPSASGAFAGEFDRQGPSKRNRRGDADSFQPHREIGRVLRIGRRGEPRLHGDGQYARCYSPSRPAWRDRPATGHQPARHGLPASGRPARARLLHQCHGGREGARQTDCRRNLPGRLAARLRRQTDDRSEFSLW
jgi:hypothetical protein